MPEMEAPALRKDPLHRRGPVPWYWETFPALRSASGQRFVWNHHGADGPVAHLVTLGLEQEPEKIGSRSIPIAGRF